MTSETVAGARAVRGSGAYAIVATVLISGGLGVVGLRQDLSVALAAVGATWALAALAMWAVYGVALLALIRRPVRRAHLLGFGVVLAVVWGGFAATDIAGRANTALAAIVANSSTTGDSGWLIFTLDPMVEETVKTLGIVLLALLPAARRFGAVAGLAVGALVGISFQIVENFVFTVQGMFNSGGGSLGVLLDDMLIRGIVGFFSHVVYSGVIGAAIGWMLMAPADTRMRRLPVVVGAFLLMTGLHMWSNWTTTIGSGLLYVVTMAVGLVAFVLVYRAVSRLDPAPAAASA